ncbi:hypothetical protein D3C80_1208220 [compost metagenome]
MQVRIVEPGDHRALLEVDDLGRRPAQGHDLGVITHRHEASVANGHGACLRPLAVHRVQAAIVQDQLGRHGRFGTAQNGPRGQRRRRVHGPGGAKHGTGGDETAAAFLILVHGGS